MRVEVEIDGRRWQVDTRRACDISIPLSFDGPQPNAFGLPQASARPFEAGGFVGDTRLGGSANCPTITMTPHGNGTHTECVGHILDARVQVVETLAPGFVAATVVTVSLEDRASCAERYVTPVERGDVVVSARSLEAALGEVSRPWCEGLVVRTQPRGADEARWRYSGMNPPFFTLDAMEVVRGLGVRHLLVDLPSVDRESDGGLLEAHHIFWGVPSGGHEAPDPVPGHGRTITEMISVGEEVEDGLYLLEIQIPPFCLDAAPSRPILYPVSSMEARR